MYFDKGKYGTHWANTSGNGLVSKLIREGDAGLKEEFGKLLKGEYIETKLDEQIIFNQLDNNSEAVWSLLLASGYLKVDSIIQEMLLVVQHLLFVIQQGELILMQNEFESLNIA